MNSILYLANLRMPTEKAYGIQIAHMCEAFAEQGIDVRLVIPTRRSAISQDIFSYYGVQNNFTVTHVYSPDFYFPGWFDRVAVLTKNVISALVLVVHALRSRGSIIYSRDELPLYLLSFFRKNGLVFEAHRFSGNRVGFYRRFLGVGVRIVAISGGIRDAFIRLGFTSERVLVAHDGVDVGKFTVGKSKEECREVLGLPKDKTIVLYTGHLYEWKGVRTLAEAARRLDERYAVVFVGGTDADILAYRNAYRDCATITFIGWRPHDDIPYYLKAADIVVLPNSAHHEISREHTSPLKMFEYMASGTPIISSDVPAIREILSEETAYFFRPDDLMDLTTAIHQVMKDNTKAREHASNAIHEVAQHTWSARARKILRYIRHER